MQAMSSNPQLAESLMMSNPWVAGNPQLQDQMRTLMPTMLEQMRRPETMQVTWLLKQKTILSSVHCAVALFKGGNSCGPPPPVC